MSAIAVPEATATAPVMCRVIVPIIDWVDLPKAKQEIELTNHWRQLEAEGFHPDLVDRAYAHLAYARKHDGEDNARAVLAHLGEGFLEPFDRAQFEPSADDPHRSLKLDALAAIEELAAFYGNRISAVIWKSLAHLACRSDPEREQSIIKEAVSGSLPYHYALVDSALHATGLVYTFLMHVNSVMFKHTGRILVHNCDCNCSLVNLEAIGGSIDYTMPRGNILAASGSVFTHCLAETWKLIQCFLPFAYSISPESREIKALL